MKYKALSLISIVTLLLAACNQGQNEEHAERDQLKVKRPLHISHIFESDTARDLNFAVEIPVTGRYRVLVYTQAPAKGEIWVEDYRNNVDDRTYDITGKLSAGEGNPLFIDGSPLAAGEHEMVLHISGAAKVDSIVFELMKAHSETPQNLVQKMDGESWSLVWSDEFDGSGLPDSSKWTHNVGNWGWGNNELQYYTDAKTENSRQEKGTLIIQALKNENGSGWTSARLTTQGKVSFTYGRIEFRAKVPSGRGTWAAGWLLGDSYRDELSWPYCGEIDVLECVGFEINDSSGSGMNHATCHTRAYYFKQGNQIGSEIEIDSMDTQFHTYAVEWYPNRIDGYVDGEHYYTYDKTANELEWPFNNPQNIIINLAVGGGWGGLKGVDSTLTDHQYILDYIRVYEKL